MRARKPKPVASLVPAKPAGPGAPLRWECIIPDVPSGENEQRRMHWSKIRREAQRWHWWLKLALSVAPQAREHRTVTFTRYAHGLLDEGDNLAASYKFVRDLLRPEKIERGVYGPKTRTPGRPWVKVHAGIGMVIGDGPGQARFHYEQVRVPASEPVRTVIVIEVT